MSDTYDLIVIGAGMAGVAAANKRGAEGWRVAIVDDSHMAEGSARSRHQARAHDPTARVDDACLSQRRLRPGLDPVTARAVTVGRRGTALALHLPAINERLHHQVRPTLEYRTGPGIRS